MGSHHSSNAFAQNRPCSLCLAAQKEPVLQVFIANEPVSQTHLWLAMWEMPQLGAELFGYHHMLKHMW